MIGVQTVAYAFPKVRLITTAVDRELNDKFHIMPGIGNFGDRYFGTELGLDDDWLCQQGGGGRAGHVTWGV